jgi:pyruvate dehydrogenase E1 component alpha subunit
MNPPSFDRQEILKRLDTSSLAAALKQMLLIRQFELRAEAAYQQGKIGGFFHSYMGQEAIQVAALQALGPSNWWITSYRCHALALLLGATPKEAMAELFGKASGNAKGRGGSMHLYADRLLGGFGIVGGQIPIATGAAFTLKYQNNKDEIAVCFMGEGAVAQGAFHESVNLASLWDLPCLFVIENNHWGMGTHVERALANQKIAEEKAPGYHLEGFTFDGMDYLVCYEMFLRLGVKVKKEQRPVMAEAITERFKGHSISDPALYRSKEELKACMEKDPLKLLKSDLIEGKGVKEEEVKRWEQEAKEIIVEALAFAEASAWPDPIELGKDVFAPETEEGVLWAPKS